MELNLITLATVKTQLGITDSTYDSDITAMIPIVSNDVRRILNTNYDDYASATITSGSAEVTFSYDTTFYSETYYKSLIPMGQVIYSPAFPDDTYLVSYDPDTSIYTFSANATADGTYFYTTLMISQWPTISKMIFYKIGKQTTDSATQQKISQIAYGNVSKTFSDAEINSKYDYPQTFIDDLGIPFARTNI